MKKLFILFFIIAHSLGYCQDAAYRLTLEVTQSAAKITNLEINRATHLAEYRDIFEKLKKYNLSSCREDVSCYAFQQAAQLNNPNDEFIFKSRILFIELDVFGDKDPAKKRTLQLLEEFDRLENPTNRSVIQMLLLLWNSEEYEKAEKRLQHHKVLVEDRSDWNILFWRYLANDQIREAQAWLKLAPSAETNKFIFQLYVYWAAFISTIVPASLASIVSMTGVHLLRFLFLPGMMVALYFWRTKKRHRIQGAGLLLLPVLVFGALWLIEDRLLKAVMILHWGAMIGIAYGGIVAALLAVDSRNRSNLHAK